MKFGRRSKKQNNIIIISLILSVFLLFGIFRFFPVISSFIHDLYYPVGDFSLFIKKQINKPFEYFSSIDSLKKENAHLKEKIDEYEILLHNYEILSQDNKRLKKLLNIPYVESYTRITASVIGQSPDIWHKELVISAGKNDGIKIDSSVIVPAGLIGKISSVSNNTSVVQLLNDGSIWISIQNNRSRSTGVLKSENEKHGKLYYLANKSDFKKDDLIFTSGLGGIYPKGIPVGIVTRAVKRTGDDIPDVTVSFFADFENIEEVIVLSKNEKSL